MNSPWLSSRKRLYAFGRAEAPAVAFNALPAFVFELYDLARRQAAKRAGQLQFPCGRFQYILV